MSLARPLPSTGRIRALELFTTRREDSAPNHAESLPQTEEVSTFHAVEDGATARVRSCRLARRNKEELISLTTTADPFPAAARDHCFLTPSDKLHHTPDATPHLPRSGVSFYGRSLGGLPSSLIDTREPQWLRSRR